MESEITLELIQKDHSEIVAAIEKPLKAQIATLTQENGDLKTAKWQSEKAVLIEGYAAKFGDKAAQAKDLLIQECKEAKTPAEVKGVFADVILMVQERAASAKTTIENLADLFPQKPAGAGVQGTSNGVAAESETGNGGVQQEFAGAMPIPA